MRTVTRYAIVFVLALLAATPSAAQVVPDDSWKVTIAPYFMGAAMNGTTAIKG
jgi:hypothetical protein